MVEDFKYNYLYSVDNCFPLHWSELPNRIRLSDGKTRTDKDTFTEEELKDAGYVFTDLMPDYNDEVHVCTWDGSNWVLTEVGFPQDHYEDDITRADD